MRSLDTASDTTPPSLQTQHTAARTPYIDSECRVKDVASDFPETDSGSALSAKSASVLCEATIPGAHNGIRMIEMC